MNRTYRKILRNRKQRIERRLQPKNWEDQPQPMLKASNIHYEMAERTSATNCGGIGAMHLMVQRLGLVEDIDRNLQLLKVHLPYHESDHVLNLTYNLLAGGQRMEDIELRRQDEVFLNGLGAERIPDPTTAGDFTRRFRVEDIVALEECVNRARLAVWKVQPEGFLKEAFIDVDGTIAQTYGLEVTRIDFPWGQAADPNVVEARLKSLKPYRGVLMTHNETSTGVLNDVETLAALIRQLNPDALIAVDAVSSLGCVPLEMDPWDLDVVFTGSQKGWMTPPGVMMIAPGPRALEANKTARLPRFYFDWASSLKMLEVGQHPTTPPVSIFYALDLALEMMLAEGREAIFERHQRTGDYVRWRAKEMGLRLLADHERASNTVTAVVTPEGIDTKALLKKLREQDQVVFAGGQGPLDGKIFRVGHLGYFQEVDLVEAMDKMEFRLREFGFSR